MSNGQFGEMFKRLRIEGGQTLRAFCVENGFDPGNISKLERGRAAAPESTEILCRYAHSLGLEEGGKEWIKFFDLANAESGKIPDDLLSNEEVVSRLPVLFRVLREKQACGEDALDRLVDKIRRA